MTKPSKPSKVPTKVKLTGAMWTPFQKSWTYQVVAWGERGALQIIVYGEYFTLTVGDEERGRAWEVVE